MSITSYHVLMSEAQRARIQAALEAYDVTNPLTFVAGNESESLEDTNLEYLLHCIKDLPATEAEHPGITHGICL